jgi:hypothetical protein
LINKIDPLGMRVVGSDAAIMQQEVCRRNSTGDVAAASSAARAECV